MEKRCPLLVPAVNRRFFRSMNRSFSSREALKAFTGVPKFQQHFKAQQRDFHGNSSAPLTLQPCTVGDGDLANTETEQRSSIATRDIHRYPCPEILMNPASWSIECCSPLKSGDHVDSQAVAKSMLAKSTELLSRSGKTFKTQHPSNALGPRPRSNF